MGFECVRVNWAKLDRVLVILLSPFRGLNLDQEMNAKEEERLSYKRNYTQMADTAIPPLLFQACVRF